MGRPKKQIDYAKVRWAAERLATQEEIAELLGVSLRTLQYDKEFLRVFYEGKGQAKTQLRDAQWSSAVHRGNVQMQIHLGKTELGQTEKVDIEHGLSGGQKEIIINVKYERPKGD
jgi:hypothetical protein